jgi:hypothetical protein
MAKLEEEYHTKIMPHIQGKCDPELCGHDEDWVAGPNSLIDCEGDLEVMEEILFRKMRERLAKVIVDGMPLETTNQAESANAFNARELQKGTICSALTYAINMFKADCRISERFLRNQFPDEPTWQKRFHTKIAAKMGISAQALYSPMQERADEESLRIKANRSNRRQSEEGLIKANIERKEKNRRKEERAGDIKESYDKGDLDERAKRAKKKKVTHVVVKDGESIKPCKCGSISHKRTSAKACPLNKKNLQAERVDADTAVTWDPLRHDEDDEMVGMDATYNTAANKAAMLAGVVEGAEVYAECAQYDEDDDEDEE